MKFILHIGAAKTRSTALQASLDKARRALEKEGVWYPVVEKRVTRRQNILATPFQRKIQRVYADKKFGGKPAAEYAVAAWDRIAKRANDYETVILSSCLDRSRTCVSRPAGGTTRRVERRPAG